MTAGIKIVGCYEDYSGYGQATRNLIAALFTQGINITTESIRHTGETLEHGWSEQLCKQLALRDIKYRVKLLIHTPEIYPTYIDKAAYNIGYMFWETDKLKADWVQPINLMDEMWTSCEVTKKAMIKAGVRVPIQVFPVPYDYSESNQDYGKYIIDKHKGFMFYSVFQWTGRKNPEGLLKTFWKAFQGRTDVSLVLKTYRCDFSKREYDAIKTDVLRWKRETGLQNTPKVFIVNKSMTRNEVLKLHNTGDCYVIADRGEGWGMPVMDAVMMGKPVIATNWSGIHELMNDSFYYPLRYSMTPAVPIKFIDVYDDSMQWAEPNMEDLEKSMLDVFLNQDAAHAKAIRLKSQLLPQLMFYRVGQTIGKYLDDLEKRKFTRERGWVHGIHM